MKKKILIILLTTLLGVNLISCGSKEPPKNLSSNNKKVEDKKVEDKKGIRVIKTKPINKNSNKSEKEQYLDNLNKLAPIKMSIGVNKTNNICSIGMYAFDKNDSNIPKYKNIKAVYTIEGKDYEVELKYKEGDYLLVFENNKTSKYIKVSDNFNMQKDVKVKIKDYE